MRQIILVSNNLQGELPENLEDMQQLVELNLGQNNYSGSIPKHLSNLPSLKRLNLSYNHFSGPIPIELYHLSKLTFLSIHHNNLTGHIPEEFIFLDELYNLYLSDNMLTGGISGIFASLDNLKTLDLSNNMLSEKISTDLMTSNTMRSINLKNNMFSGTIPEGFGDLDELEELNLGNNNFKGCIPQDLKELCSINVELSGNFQLAWTGDFYSFCNSNGLPNNQYGQPCNDGIEANGTNDVINNDCSCGEASLLYKNEFPQGQLFYPNPTSGSVFIELDEAILFSIYDFTGKLLKSGSLNNGTNELTISELPGIYFLSLDSKIRRSFHKIIVQ